MLLPCFALIMVFQVALEITTHRRFLTFRGSRASSCMGWYTNLTTCSLAGNTQLFCLCTVALRFVGAITNLFSLRRLRKWGIHFQNVCDWVCSGAAG